MHWVRRLVSNVSMYIPSKFKTVLNTLHQWYSTGGTRRHLRGYV